MPADLPPLTDEEERRLRGEDTTGHRRLSAEEPYCVLCDGLWPCCTVSIARLLATLDAARRERDEYDHALHSLTPGGSEFAHDAKACVAYVRKVQRGQHESIARFKSELDAARAALAEAKAAFREFLTPVEERAKAEERERIVAWHDKIADDFEAQASEPNCAEPHASNRLAIFHRASATALRRPADTTERGEERVSEGDLVERHPILNPRRHGGRDAN